MEQSNLERDLKGGFHKQGGVGGGGQWGAGEQEVKSSHWAVGHRPARIPAQTSQVDEESSLSLSVLLCETGPLRAGPRL